MATKVCSKCGVEKPVAEFGRTSRARGRKPTSECTQCLKDRCMGYWRRNRESRLEYDKTYREENSIRVKEADRTRTRRRYQRLKEQDPGYLKEKSTKSRHRRRALEKECKSDGSITQKFLRELRGTQGNQCFYCSCDLDYATPGSVHLDHKIPLSRGGENTSKNVVYACSDCNLRKGSKTSEEFLSA